MIVTKKFSFDLDTRGISPLMYAVQGEVNTRKVEISLFSNGTAWEIPDETVVAVAYRKPDGTKGLYDKLPTGESASAVSGNVVTVMLAPQVLTCAGKVMASIIFYSKDMVNTLATFPFQIHVEKNPGAGEQISNNYYYLQNLDQVNTELQDIRVGYDGVIYPTAGDAVRQQIASLLSQLSGSGGGLNNTAVNLLVTILLNGIYETDQSSNIAALAAELESSGSGGEPVGKTYYVITNNLTGISNSNEALSVLKDSAYTATLSVDGGGTIGSVTITMGGVDVTEEVYTNGVISIEAVTGNVVITANPAVLKMYNAYVCSDSGVNSHGSRSCLGVDCGEVPMVASNGTKYYPIPVPAKATKFIIKTPITRGINGYALTDGVYTRTYDSGWSSDNPHTETFAAGTYDAISVNFQNATITLSDVEISFE